MSGGFSKLTFLESKEVSITEIWIKFESKQVFKSKIIILFDKWQNILQRQFREQETSIIFKIECQCIMGMHLCYKFSDTFSHLHNLDHFESFRVILNLAQSGSVWLKLTPHDLEIIF